MLQVSRSLCLNKALVSNRSLLLQSSKAYLSDTTVGGGFGSFNKREQAQENQFIRNLEKEQLARIRDEIKRHKDELVTLENKINEISKRHKDGEQNSSKD